MLYNSNTICVNMAVFVLFYFTATSPTPNLYRLKNAQISQQKYPSSTDCTEKTNSVSIYFLKTYLPHKTLKLKIKQKNRNIYVIFSSLESP